MSGGAVRAVAERVRRETGMVVKDAQLPALEAAIGRAAPGMSAERFLAELSGRAPGALWHRLVDEVTVPETYFFRERRELEAIDWRRLVEAAREGGFGAVRVWVVGCSTGEEAYSLAILASEALGRGETPVTILATDVSHGVLRRAEAGGGYSQRSVRDLPVGLRERYLFLDDGRYHVKDSLRSLVRFRHHNLIDDPSPPLGEVVFDVITCRNVLIYFDPPTVERALRSLEAGLRPGGRLILGAADRLTTVGSFGRDLAGQAERRRRRGPVKPALRRPLGLDPRPGEEAGPPAAVAVPAAAERPLVPRRRAEDRVEDALLAADRGDLDAALEIVEALLVEDPTMVDAYFVRGLVELDRGDLGAAIGSLRRALYLDPTFGLAAFELGRAHDAGDDPPAARRAYAQALRTLDPEDERHRVILDQVVLADVAAACAARLQGESEGAP